MLGADVPTGNSTGQRCRAEQIIRRFPPSLPSGPSAEAQAHSCSPTHTAAVQTCTAGAVLLTQSEAGQLLPAPQDFQQSLFNARNRKPTAGCGAEGHA